MDNLQNAKYAIDRATGDYGGELQAQIAIAYALVALVERLDKLTTDVSLTNDVRLAVRTLSVDSPILK